MEKNICNKCKIEKPLDEFKINYSIKKPVKWCNECFEESKLIYIENKNNEINNIRKCITCLETKEIIEFRKNKKNYISHECNKCSNTKRLNYCNQEFVKEKIRIKAKEYRKSRPLETKMYDKKFRKEYHHTIKGYAFKIYSNAKRRANLKNLKFELTSEWVYDKVKNMKCEITGIELSLTDLKDIRINPYKPTLDKVNNNEGYTKENTKVVCWWWNVMKQDWSEETVKNLINEYLKNKQNE
jgi:hypothetical protein